jgi:hypothetical protein
MAKAAKKKPRGAPQNMRPIKKGTHPVGRAKGTPNVISRALKDALIYAAEHSMHSNDGSLEGYMLTVADDRMAKQRHKQIGVFCLPDRGQTTRCTKVQRKRLGEFGEFGEFLWFEIVPEESIFSAPPKKRELLNR